MKRVFLGGSFDPVHDGHLGMVRAVARHLASLGKPYEIDFLPTAGNPFKGTPTDPTHRLAMLDLACEILKSENIFAQICPLEIHQTPPVYTIDTVKYFNEKYPNDTLIFVMGGDSLASLHLWKNFEEIFNFVKIWAFARVGATREIDEQIKNQLSDDFGDFTDGQKSIFYDTTPIVAVSSSQIRTALANGEAVPHLPTPILTYIKHHQLYKTVL
ncbi:MAG: nicotinate (nicotinamide) nucleotide adenylyltransferase [Moraxella equi]|nr:nicotinate (nicotinamide) nucleotide adenylyltransferase [Moraxella equi]